MPPYRLFPIAFARIGSETLLRCIEQLADASGPVKHVEQRNPYADGRRRPQGKRVERVSGADSQEYQSVGRQYC